MTTNGGEDRERGSIFSVSGAVNWYDYYTINVEVAKNWTSI